MIETVFRKLSHDAVGVICLESLEKYLLLSGVETTIVNSWKNFPGR